MPRLFGPAAGALAATLLVFGAVASADEGMWTFDSFPAAKVQQQYGFAPDQKWLDRVSKVTVRLENGCSGSVVSKDGLVLTNHHCVTDCTAALSSPGNDYVDDGFYTAARKDERICPGAEASILQSVTDVTARVGADPSARARIISDIEDEACAGKSRLRCDVMSMYRGGQYKLYVYDRYDDVRIAFTPEMQAASFGGDPDNFNYPRYALDASFLRAYENGKPVKVTSFLKWSPRAPIEGEATFVVGNPGSTQRLFTSEQIAFQREVALPLTLALLLRPWQVNPPQQFLNTAGGVADVRQLAWQGRQLQVNGRPWLQALDAPPQVQAAAFDSADPLATLRRWVLATFTRWQRERLLVAHSAHTMLPPCAPIMPAPGRAFLGILAVDLARVGVSIIGTRPAFAPARPAAVARRRRAGLRVARRARGAGRGRAAHDQPRAGVAGLDAGRERVEHQRRRRADAEHHGARTTVDLGELLAPDRRGRHSVQRVDRRNQHR